MSLPSGESCAIHKKKRFMENTLTNRPVPPPPTGVVATRIQLFLEKISPLSNDLAAGGKRKAAALRKLRRLCETEVDKLRKGFALPTVKLYLSHYRNALRAIDPNHPAIIPRIDKHKQRFSYLALTRAETQQINAAYQTEIHEEQSQLMPLDPEATVQTARKLLTSERYLNIGIGLMLLTGRRPAEIFSAGDFSLPPKRTSVPTLIFSGQLKTRGHLRSANAKICSLKFKPPHLGEDPYFAQI